MAGHIQDRWYKTEKGPDGRPRRVRTDRYGTGKRYRARYIGPDGTEKNQSFPNGEKRKAEAWLNKIKNDMTTGSYLDPVLGQTTFEQYAAKWLESQTTDVATRDAVEMRLRLHAFPHLGRRPLGSFRPEHIRDWGGKLEAAGMPGSYRRAVFSNVRAVLSAAVDDGYLSRNPCQARSVTPPKPDPRRVVPWTAERVFAVRDALPEKYAAMVDLGAGCGLRQGEIFGTAVGALDTAVETVHVVLQVKLVKGKPVFAPPKGGKLRDVPLPPTVFARLRAHMNRFPPVDITLPWLTPTGAPVTHRLVFPSLDGGAVRRNDFNRFAWKPALAAAGVIPTPEPGGAYEKAREHGMHALRHFYASVLLDSGENIKALAEYLGHADPGFTLRTYTHLMPSSRSRTLRAVDRVYGRPSDEDHGPQTAQAA